MQLKMQALRRWILLWLLNNPPLRIILVSLLVCYLHFSLFVAIVHQKPAPVIPKKRIAVRTVEVAPQKVVVHRTATAVKPKKVAASVRKKPSNGKKKDLYKKLEKQISSIAKPIKKPEKGKLAHVPKSITPKKVEQVVEEVHTAYLEEVLSLFHDSLELPEIGTVTAKVELSKEGTFLSCTILSSQSAKNAVYLQNHLPQLSYPPFNGSLTNKERESFEITFRNAQ